MKNCSTCKVEKPFSEFYTRGDRTKTRPRHQCKRCYLDGRNASRVNKKQRVKRYGLTLEQYDTMVATHLNKCAICGLAGEFSAKGALAIDHDHRTGKVRGLLCGECNTGLGKFRDSTELLRRATFYLEHS